jgi:superfamily II DNA or RNA helicase
MERLLAHRFNADLQETEYLVKWKLRGYHACRWVTSSHLDAVGESAQRKRYEKKVKKSGAVDPERPFPRAFAIPDRVLTVERDPATGAECFLIKWAGLPYDESTWEGRDALGENPELLLEQFAHRNNLPAARAVRAKPRPDPSEFGELDGEYAFKDGHQLRPYQREGFNWLRQCWFEQRNSILADEMGLGKTVQTVSIVEYLRRDFGMRGPFLVIAPLSTLPHWKREFEGWTDMNVVVYHGTAQSRDMIRYYDWWFYDERGQLVPRLAKFEVLITTYEVLLADERNLSQFSWQYCAIDEAHRLKNNASKSLEAVRRLSFDHLLLLTGTPLQNNTAELWTLLSLLDRERFASERQFLTSFGDLRDANQVAALHEVLRPLMLRRMKDNVDKDIGRKEETIIFVELTRKQKEYYRAILERNFSFLKKGAKASNAPSLLNIVMELRKCCNHPFLIKGAEDSITNGSQDATEIFEAMVSSSGKMVLLDKLLPHLRAGGHKVLIFSQMVKVLDLLEDYCRWRAFPFERLDGNVKGTDRQAAIDRFTVAESTDDAFVFLLCTRAGGVGINLTAADTCVIFDSDWNPQNDIQAQARCHRIGQDKAVSVYRLITRGTYELEMFERASKKLGLDQAVLTNMESTTPGDGAAVAATHTPLDRHEINDLLKNGAYGVFRDDDEAADAFTSADITQILARHTKKMVLGGAAAANGEAATSAAAAESVAEAATNAGENGGESRLGNVSRATFAVDEADDKTAPRDINGNLLDISDPAYWEKLMPGSKQQNDPRILDAPRQRKNVARFLPRDFESDDEGGAGGGAGADDEVDAFQDDPGDYEDDEDGDEDEDGKVAGEDDGGAAAAARAAARAARRNTWRVSERNRLKASLLTLGYGRWDDLKKHAQLERWTAHDVRLFSRALVRQLVVHANAAAANDPKAQPVVFETLEPRINNAPTLVAAHELDVMRRRERVAAALAANEDPAALYAQFAADDEQFEREVAASEQAEQAAFAAAVTAGARPEGAFDKDVTLFDDRFVGHVVKFARKTLRRLEMLAQLGDAVRYWLPLLDHARIEGTDFFAGSTIDDDKALLIGFYKHGFGFYSAIQSDPELPFATRTAPIKGGAANDGADDLDGDGDGAVDGGASTVDTTTTAAAATMTADAMPPTAVDGAAISGLPEWPNAKVTAQRVKRLMRAIDAKRAAANREPKPERKRERKVDTARIEEKLAEAERLNRVWSKAEMNNLYRDLTIHGEPRRADGTFDWAPMKERAKLQRKTVEQIDEFYPLFLSLVHKKIESDAPKRLESNGDAATTANGDDEDGGAALDEPPNDANGAAAEDVNADGTVKDVPLTYLQCKRLVQRIQLLRTLREQVLAHPERDIKLLNAKKHGLPVWWTPKLDQALLYGVDRHGMGQWEDIVRDPELPFCAIAESKGARQGLEERAAVLAQAPPRSRNRGNAAAATTDGVAPEGAAANGGDAGEAAMTAAMADNDVLRQRAIQAAKTRKEKAVYCNAIGWPREAPLNKRIDQLMAAVLQPEADAVVAAPPKQRVPKRARTADIADVVVDSTTSAPPPQQEVASATAATAAAAATDPVDDADAQRRAAARAAEPPRDEQGNVILPLYFGAMALLSLGTVVTDRPEFHTDRYVYPVGFRTSREFLSMKNPGERTLYTSEIVDEGGPKPVFQVTPSDDPSTVIRAPSSSAAWKAVLMAVNALRSRSMGKTYTSSVSGPEYFGFAHPVVCRLLSTLPGVEQCSRYAPMSANQPPAKRARSQRRRSLLAGDDNGDDAADDGDEATSASTVTDGGACKIRLPTSLFRAAQQPASALPPLDVDEAPPMFGVAAVELAPFEAWSTAPPPIDSVWQVDHTSMMMPAEQHWWDAPTEQQQQLQQAEEHETQPPQQHQPMSE